MRFEMTDEVLEKEEEIVTEAGIPDYFKSGMYWPFSVKLSDKFYELVQKLLDVCSSEKEPRKIKLKDVPKEPEIKSENAGKTNTDFSIQVKEGFIHVIEKDGVFVLWLQRKKMEQEVCVVIHKGIEIYLQNLALCGDGSLYGEYIEDCIRIIKRVIKKTEKELDEISYANSPWS